MILRGLQVTPFTPLAHCYTVSAGLESNVRGRSKTFDLSGIPTDHVGPLSFDGFVVQRLRLVAGHDPIG